jgi:hypothetical protein
MLEKVISVDFIEVIENGTVQVRTKTAFKEGGVEIGSIDCGNPYRGGYGHAGPRGIRHSWLDC